MAQKKSSRKPLPRMRAGDAPTGCGYTQSWTPITSIEGMTPVWITNAQYEKIAAALLKKTKDKHAKALLRARAHPIEMTWTCGGTCSGGWCKEAEVPQPDEPSAVFVCECQYFV